MRLWTLHPKYLDRAGLVALWREALLASAVLKGETRGYRRHPQLYRFKSIDSPLCAINAYLSAVLLEADSRGYSFNRNKVGQIHSRVRITSTDGQLAYEWQHLLGKLQTRNPDIYQTLLSVEAIDPHPLFIIEPGQIEHWERLGS